MSRPISRVLSWTVIHLGNTSPHTSSNLPGSNAGHAITPLFDLAPSGVYHATKCCHSRGALLPHPFTLTVRSEERLRRFALCCTGRGLAPPRCYLALCPMEPGLSSRQMLKNTGRATVWSTRAELYTYLSCRGRLLARLVTRPLNPKAGEIIDHLLCGFRQCWMLRFKFNNACTQLLT